MNPTFAKYYQQFPQDTGITSPKGYTLGADPEIPYVFRADMQAGGVPLYTNPAGALYASGLQNLTLTAPTAEKCETGCLANYKPDPRVFQVKPLYAPTIYNGPEPTAYTALGMY